MAPVISKRAKRAHGDIIDYGPFVKKAWDNPYSVANPEGKILLAVAENKLAYPLLAPALRQAAHAAIDDDGVSNYGPVRGHSEFQVSLAKFLSRQLTRTPIAPDHISILCGVAAILDILAHTLFDPGDVLLIPAPYYAAFDNDLVVRSSVRIQPVSLSAPDWELTEKALDEAASNAGGQVAGLLLTTPHNPFGTIYSISTLRMAHAWCQRHEAHLISDELYGACVFGGEENEDGLKSNRPQHISIAQVCPDGRLGDRNHILWGFSKDFGISGFRVGVLVSENDDLNKALANVGLFSNVPRHTQAMLQRLLDDEPSIDSFLEANCTALRSAYTTCVQSLRSLHIPFIPAVAGMFILIDCRELLDELTYQAERNMLQELFDDYGMLLTPGRSMHAPEPGWFRICYAFVDSSVLRTALERLGTFVRKRRELSRPQQEISS